MSVIGNFFRRLLNRNMSVKHLGPGSVEPPRVNGLLRVYSMKVCPFAKRARLVLKAKNVPHDIVNIDLQNKPDWYFKIHPKGQVPALFDGEKIVIESLDIADYLDEKYSTINPLYPKDLSAKQHDQWVIKNLFGPAMAPLGKIVYSVEKEPITVEGALKELLPSAQPLEDELAKRPGPFFGGDKPGMIDYMLWPFAERALALLPFVLKVEKIPLGDQDIPVLRKWAKAMKNDSVVKELHLPFEVLVKVLEARQKGTYSYKDLFNE